MQVNKICNELHTFLSLGKTMEWIAEHYSIDMQLAWAIRLWEKSDKERAEAKRQHFLHFPKVAKLHLDTNVN